MQSREESALRSRLAIVMSRFSQAEIARKTGVATSSVSRYLSGTQIPGSFLVSLVRQTGVNPTWLLAGQGSPWIHETAAAGTSDLVGLVQSMNVLSRMALGAIAGRGHAPLLRQLEREAAEADQLRNRLNAASAPALERVLEEARAALNAFDVRRCAEAVQLARQVGRFCRDEALLMKLAELESRLAMWERRGAEAVKHYRPVFLARLSAASADPAEAALATLRYSLMLQQDDRPEEACRVAQAASAFLGHPGQAFPAHPLLGLAAAVPLVEIGRLEDAFAAARLSLPGLVGNRRQVIQALLVHAQLLAGILTVSQAILMGPHLQALGQSCVQFAAFREDAPGLAQSLAYLGGKRLQRDVPDPELPAYGRRVLALLQRRKRRAAPAPDLHPPAAEGAARFRSLAFKAHVERLSGEASAKASAMEAQALLDRLPDGVTPALLARALHARNLLQTRGVQEKLRQRALCFLRRHVAAGYGAFGGLGGPEADGPAAGGPEPAGRAGF